MTILIFLYISYQRMYLPLDKTIFISTVTIISGIMSFVIHFIITRPIERSISIITSTAKHISENNFKETVPQIGPLEFQSLAKQFNEMSRKLDDSFAKVQASEQARVELVANVSHDLRTPMTSIQSFVEALQDDVIQDEQTRQKYLETIGTETSRLSRLIDDLFLLSRLDSKADTFEPELHHMESRLFEVLQSFQLKLERKKIEVKVDVPDQLPRIPMMPYQIDRVLANLMDNAINFTHERGHIHISVTEEKESIQVQICNEGHMDMEKEEQSKIFERFYRADQSRQRVHGNGGAGLGLAICKSIVELHGGQIGVTPQESMTCFWFKLPIQEKKEV